MADEAPKPAPLTFAQQIAAIPRTVREPGPIGPDNPAMARRLEAIARQQGGLPPAQPAGKPGTPPPTWDQYFASQRGTVQPAAETGAVTSDAAATAPGAAPDSPAAPPTEADLVVPASAAEYTISLPPDLPPDIEVSAAITDRIRRFAHASQMNQGTVNRMVMARIAADKQAFTDQANSVIAATSAARVQAVGSFLAWISTGCRRGIGRNLRVA
jgi:hypothetical protein